MVGVETGPVVAAGLPGGVMEGPMHLHKVVGLLGPPMASLGIEPQTRQGTQSGKLAKELTADDTPTATTSPSTERVPTPRRRTTSRSTLAVDLRPSAAACPSVPPPQVPAALAAISRHCRSARRPAIRCSPPGVRSCRVGTAPPDA